MHPFGHLKTITYHKLLVMRYCFRVGLIRQGLMHDMSKYSWTEFRIGVKYYSGTHSPNATERQKLGYSTAWLHHKGRNKHHLEYWIDYGLGTSALQGQPMPTKYMAELCLDRIAACRVYHGKDYTDRDPLEYLEKSRDGRLMHPRTRAQVVEVLTVLAERGEKEMLRYLRQLLKEPVKSYSNLPPAPGDPADKDGTFASPGALQTMAEQLGTPFYLYDQAGIRETCREIQRAFSWNPGFLQFFPVKAAPTAGILKLLRQEGQGVVCSSAAELKLCQLCGFSPEEILFMPNYPGDEDLRMAAEVGCCPVLDSPGLVDRFGEMGLLHGTVGLRITPEGIFRFGWNEIKTEGVKFGMTKAQALETAKRLKDLGVKELGVMSYLSGNTLSPDYAPRLAEMLCDTALAVREILPVRYLNISGGLGIPYKPGETGLFVQDVSRAVRQTLEEKLPKEMREELAIYTELGRYTTGPHGILVTRVTEIKEKGKKFAGVDASAADLMRPMLYGAYHHISVVGKEGASRRENWDVVGAVCENTDKFAEDRALPPLEIGDLLVIHDAGAHCHSMGYNYGGRLRCGEYLLTEKGPAELRRRETISDYLAAQVLSSAQAQQ